MLTKESNSSLSRNSSASRSNNQDIDEYDPEQFIGSSQVYSLFYIHRLPLKINIFYYSQPHQIPILVIGTKLDLAEEVRIPQFNRRPSPIAEECGAAEIYVVYYTFFKLNHIFNILELQAEYYFQDCTAPTALAPGSSSAVKLSRFFDLVIDKRFHNRDRPSPFTDKRRLLPGYSSANNLNHKTFHLE